MSPAGAITAAPFHLCLVSQASSGQHLGEAQHASKAEASETHIISSLQLMST